MNLHCCRLYASVAVMTMLKPSSRSTVLVRSMLVSWKAIQPFNPGGAIENAYVSSGKGFGLRFQVAVIPQAVRFSPVAVHMNFSAREPVTWITIVLPKMASEFLESPG